MSNVSLNNKEGKVIVKTIIIAILTLAAGLVHAHSGDTNSQGCHNDYKTGGYHCH